MYIPTNEIALNKVNAYKSQNILFDLWADNKGSSSSTSSHNNRDRARERKNEVDDFLLLLSFALFEIIESFFLFSVCLLILLQCQKEKRDAK